jgi:RNA polymerase sigma-70 factor (ECF subfamily)
VTETVDRKTPLEDRRVWLQSVFERLQQPLTAYALKLVNGDWNRAQDCVQEAFVRLCREDTEKVAAHVDAWLYKTCRNHAMDIHRKEARMTVHSDSAPLTDLTSREASPAHRFVQDEDHRRLTSQIAQLPKLEQEVVQLRLGEGLSYKEIADITELSVSHVGVLLHQAVKRLRKSLVPPDGIASA